MSKLKTQVSQPTQGKVNRGDEVAGEFQVAASIHTGSHRVHVVVQVVVLVDDELNGSLITHDVACELPLHPQNVCEEFLVGAGRNSIDTAECALC